MSKFVCMCEHLCVCIPVQIYIIYTIFVLPLKKKRCFLIKCQTLAIKKNFLVPPLVSVLATVVSCSLPTASQ